MVRGFDINKPKEPQDTQTQEHDNEDITTSNVGPEHDSPGFTDVFLGPDETSILKLVRQKRVRILHLDMLKRGSRRRLTRPEGATQSSSIWSDIKEKIKIPKGYFYRPKETLQSLSTWYLGSDTDKPKEPQDTQTQEQSDEVITTPNAGPEHDSSDSTGAATGSDEATNTDVHQEEENEGSTAEQTQAEVHREESPKPEETVQSPSKLAESAQEIMKLLKLPNLPNYPA
ncbi:hypothetical protein BASA50_004702 [Batrachochytrium salamandrivorans]|uniref:Uncharacterized protein n=1 Tax=Batrachochytrium salamandrivorans TaxID=1357716 RepID=A0ABQ8FET7_9FUNG|nr:hypothetical protein BASA50_004702 [Batrachochytrium salamandrivorans]